MKKILLVGTGAMAVEYAKVLKALGNGFEVMGNSLSGCNEFFKKTSIMATPNFFEQENKVRAFDYVINSVSADKLFDRRTNF